MACQGQRKVEKSEEAHSNTRLFEETGFMADSVKIWRGGGSCPPLPPGSASPACV